MNRRGIDWQSRIFAALATVIISEVHERTFGNPESTRFAVTLYLATSALFNAFALLCYTRIVRGKLSSDLQHLAYGAIILNFLAWVTYMVNMSPQVVNIMTSAVTYGTFTRLLWVSDGDIDVGGWKDLLHRAICFGSSLFRWSANRASEIYIEKAKP